PTSIPGFRVQRVDAAVRMGPGKTLVLGGLVVKKDANHEEELFFLVTPDVFDPSAPAAPQVQLDVMCAAVKGAAARPWTSRWTDCDDRRHPPKYQVFKDGNRLRADLLALADKGLARVAEPRLITQSGRPSWTVLDGGEAPIVTTSGTG